MLQYPSFSRFKAAPPKEGRSRTPYKNTCAPKRRRTALLRLLIFAAIITISYAVVVSLFLPSIHVHAAPNGQDLHKKIKRAQSGSITKDAKPSISVKSSPKQTLVESADRQEQHVIEEPETSQSVPSIDLHPKHKDRLTKHNDDSHFDAALTRVISMLPDEIHVREMLRSIDGTGKEKLRETGLRARAYKEFFEAWENLHLVSDADDIHVRDDVIQTLRSHNPSKSLASTVRSYEAYRSFLQRLSTMLFPWTAPYFADHMMLHTHFHKGGRGIVLSAGDNQAPYLLTSIQSFRRLGCTLPIEIMYLGDSDLSEDYRAELEMLPDVVTRDLSQMVNDEGWRLAGWAGKPFAILMSR
jgi:alpha 1,3-mannosyltransferase